jgi:hypothetical protein
MRWIVFALLVACSSSSNPATPDSLVCAPGKMACDGVCIDPMTDADHCGSCSPCSLENATASCVAGQCTLESCNAGFCDLDGMPGCEAEPNLLADPNHCGSCANTCSSGTCVAGACTKRVFVTNNSYPANTIGGLAGADTICMTEASGLGGTWKAWLGDSTKGPSLTFTKSPGPYVRLDGATIATSWSDLTDGVLGVPIAIDPLGQLLTGAGAGAVTVWTNVNPTGATRLGTDSCADWSSTTGVGDHGQSDVVNANWTFGGSLSCNSAAVTPGHLYCFEQ